MRPLLIAQVAVTTAVGAFLSTLAALFVVEQTLELGAGLLMRALLVTVVLLVAPWVAVRTRLLRSTRRQLRAGAGVGLILGYALNPTTWTGRAYVAQILVGPGPLAVALDLVLWLVVGGAAAVLASAPASAREPATYATP